MSFDVKFYSFSKRVNSTKQPSGSSGTTFSCNLKEETSILNPTIILNTSSSDVIGYNYAYISSFNRYYFIKDVRAVSLNIWELDMSCDVMATYKTGIGSMTPYVLRSASESDEYILDTIYPADSYITEFIAYPPDGEDRPMMMGGTSLFVIGVIGAGTEPVGAVNYYIMNKSSLVHFIGFLMLSDITTWSGISASDYSPGVQAALVNPMQYIVSCIAVPFTFADNPSKLQASPATSIYFGHYEFPVPSGDSVYHVLYQDVNENWVQFKTGKILMPSHPQASTRGKYLNGAPYSEYILHFDPIGDIPLNGNDGTLITAGPTDDDRYITYTIQCNIITGEACIDVLPGKVSIPIDPIYTKVTTPRLVCANFQAGIPIQLAQAFTDPIALQTAKGNIVGTALSSVISGNAGTLGGAYSSINANIGDAMRAQYPTVQTMGSNGALLQSLQIRNGIYVKSKHHRIVTENNADLGRPLCHTKTINTLSGYILCSGADYGGAGTSDERDQINNYLNTGFFYE